MFRNHIRVLVAAVRNWCGVQTAQLIREFLFFLLMLPVMLLRWEKKRNEEIDEFFFF
ncbi:hypothetical protein MTR_5g012150 [Medicago truncatula]|uniref:Uncharacterized protein n=1 Tax=Medicago truncatula TaxID=3880 RepID=G7JVZ8_MEDTR|nr:hypothetical protein MTR_5g012150 [Medicago truncatula]